MANPRCFFDITADGKPLGRIVMELRADVVPKQPKISELYVLEKKALVTRVHHSIV